MKEIIKNALILMAITLTAGLALGAVHEITKEPIEAQEKKTKEEACKAVFPEAENFEAWTDFDAEAALELLASAGFSADKVDEVSLAEDEKGEVLGAVLNLTSTEGYGGNISFSMGILKDGTVTGIKILSSARLPVSACGHGGELLRPVCRTKGGEFFLHKDGSDG